MSLRLRVVSPNGTYERTAASWSCNLDRPTYILL